MILRADVVVIGGGIVGAACAHYLCAEGLGVCLLERRFPASGTSRACDGLIASMDKNPGVELALAQASAALWSGLAETLEGPFDYARKGSVWVAENEEGLAACRTRAEGMRGAGVSVEFLDGRGLRLLEPNLAPDLPGGVFFPADAAVDPRRATVAMLAAAQKRGLVLRTDAEVVAIRRASHGEGGVSAVVTRAGEIATEAVVCAAGVWSEGLARMVGVPLPIRPRKGHILVTARAPGIIRHPLLEAGYVSTLQAHSEDVQVALVAEMTAKGTMLLGSSRQFVGLDLSVSLPVVQAIAARAVRFLPALSEVGVIRTYAGLRPWSPDHLPLIGPLKGVPGFYLATGHEGTGICLAPITGRLIADWVIKKGPSPTAVEVLPDRLDLTGGAASPMPSSGTREGRHASTVGSLPDRRP